MTAELKNRNPYPGPRPFETEEQNLFFGREREMRELLSLIYAHRVVLLYAQSGAGKTSLLNAGLIPLLTKEEFEVLPVARVRGFKPEDIGLREIPNIYVFNTLMRWAVDIQDPKPFILGSIADFLKEHGRLKDKQELPLPKMIILDQFEEVFTVYPEHWKEREGFILQVAEALKEDPLLRVLFVIREEYLASMDSFIDYLPERMRTRYRLEHLRQEAACSAVEGPLQNTEYSFAEGVALNLVQQLLKIRVESTPGETIETEGEFVQPVQLQVVCQNLWINLPPNVTSITSEHVRIFGDVDEALKGFYEKTIKTAVEKSDVKESELRKWFGDKLITLAGTRGTVFRGKKYTEGIPNSAVDVLEDQHLIRAEMRARARWYELIHDRLIDPIRKSNEVWLQHQHIKEQARISKRFFRKFILISAFLVWNLILIIIHQNSVVQFDFPKNLIVLFFGVICIPLLITIAIYLWRYPPVIKVKILKISMQLFRIILSILLLYTFYGVINFVFYTEVKIESDKIIKKINFVKKSSFLPLLPHKHEHEFQLDIEQAETFQSLTTIYAYKQLDDKQLDKKQVIIIPWGNYDISYNYGAEDTTVAMRLSWNFRTFRQTLLLL